MTVKFKTSLVGATFSHSPGDVVDIDDAVAGRLIAADFAVPFSQPLETADVQQPELETATVPNAAPAVPAAPSAPTRRRRANGTPKA